MAFNTEIPLFDLPHILCTLTFTDVFWNNHHFQKLEEKLGSMCFRWGIIPEPVDRIEVLSWWFGCLFPSCLYLSQVGCISYEPKGLSCGFPSEPLEEDKWWESSRNLKAGGDSARALPQPLQLPEALLEEQPVQPCHLQFYQ